MKLYDVEGALSDWEQAIARDITLAKKFDTPELRASVESALQQIRAVSIDPTSAQYYMLMGRAYAVFGRLALSLQAYTSALRISPRRSRPAWAVLVSISSWVRPSRPSRSCRRCLSYTPIRPCSARGSALST